LSHAIREKNHILIALLLDKGMEVDLKDTDELRNTPLEAACIYGYNPKNAEAIVTKSQRRFDALESRADHPNTSICQK
jgi:ankyrin repeat protein